MEGTYKNHCQTHESGQCRIFTGLLIADFMVLYSSKALLQLSQGLIAMGTKWLIFTPSVVGDMSALIWCSLDFLPYLLPQLCHSWEQMQEKN